jgi:2'-5' RNA ligase
MASVHALYLFLSPPPPVCEAIARHRDLPGMARKPIPDDRLHMTVGGFGSFDETPQAGIEWVRERLSAVTLPSFRLYLDTLIRPAGRALLIPSEAPAGFGRLQQALTAQLGIHRTSWRDIRPHVTLGYGGSRARTEAIDPIGWTADDLRLVESIVGEGRHIVHAAWTLDAQARLAA